MTKENLEIHVRLFGILREKLPPEENGRTVLTVPEGTTIAGILTILNLSGHFHVAVNEEIVEDRQTPLKDGDQLDVLPPSAGGGR